MTPSERSFKNKIKSQIKEKQEPKGAARSLATSYFSRDVHPVKNLLKLEKNAELQVSRKIEEIEKANSARKNRYGDMLRILKDRN